MNLVCALDNKTSKELVHLAPHKNSLNLNKLRAQSKVARFPKPVTSTIANWYYFKEDYVPDANKAQFMEAISY